MQFSEQDDAANQSLRERSVSWSEGLNGGKAENTEAARRLQLLLAQSQDQVAAAANSSPYEQRRGIATSEQAAEERHKADYDRLTALSNSKQRLLEARLRAKEDEAERYKRNLEEVARERHNIPTRTSVSLGDLQAAAAFAKQQPGGLGPALNAHAGRPRYQPSMPALSGPDHHPAAISHQPSFGSQLSVPFSNLNAQLSAELLNKERDDLLAVNSQLRSRVERCAARERELTEQMRRALELANRMQLERADALVRASRAEEELNNVRHACEEQLGETQRAFALERASFALALERAGEPGANAELNSRVLELEDALAVTTLKNERLTEENRSMRDEVARRVAATREFEERAARIREELAASVTRASSLRDAAQQDAARAQRALERVSEQLDTERVNNERVRSTHEGMLKRAEAQYEALKSYAMHVAEVARANERRADEAIAERDSIVATQSEQLNAVSADREARERELLASVQHYQTRYETAAREMTSLAEQQNALIAKLKDECVSLHSAVERSTCLKDEVVGQAQLERDEFAIKNERLRNVVNDLEVQNREFQRTNDELRERVLELERRAQTNSLYAATNSLRHREALSDASRWNTFAEDQEATRADQKDRRPIADELRFGAA